MTYTSEGARRSETDKLLTMQQADREIRRPPATPRRRMPKTTRMQSSRQRIAESQTANDVAAIYKPEHERSQTPLASEDIELTRSPGQKLYGYTKVARKQRRTRMTPSEWEALAAQYDI